MGILDNVKETIITTGQEVGEKAKIAAEIVKLKANIHSCEKGIDRMISQIGLKCVQNHINETGTEYDEFFSEILRLRAEIVNLNRQVEDVKASWNEKAENTEEDVSETVKDIVKDTAETVEETVNEAAETVEETVNVAAENAEETVNVNIQ
ncbi:MAG: hypothetical protein Q4B47_02880 [Eubacteriales bacterium]|nr:hypothetical protein [Eubacteriales bacterium]